MHKDQCFELGYISGVHGYEGTVTAVFDADNPSTYGNMQQVFVEVKNTLVPYFIERIQVRGTKALIKFEEVGTEEKALLLKGTKLFLPLTSLPALADDQYYFHEIIGYRVHDERQGPLGTVLSVYTLPHQNLLAMELQGQEVLIPITDEIVLGVDKAEQQVRTRLPEGLIEVYLNTGTGDEEDEQPEADDEQDEDDNLN